jgi:hypothetical protein
MSDNQQPKKKATPSKKTPSKSTPAKKKAQASGSSKAQTGTPKKSSAAAKKSPAKKSVAKKAAPVVKPDPRPADTEIQQTEEKIVSAPEPIPTPVQTAAPVAKKKKSFWSRLLSKKSK